MNGPIIDIKHLVTQFFTYEGIVKALDGVDLVVWPGEIFGLVGETGCGKSVTVRSIMRLIDSPGKIVSGSVLFNGQNLLALNEKEMSQIRGEKIAMIFQEPLRSLNPVKKIGTMMSEVIRLHHKVSKGEALSLATKSLGETEMPDPEKILKQYPHELSGGMRQRVMIATAISLQPKLLIADEPTTALDVTIQAQILRLISKLKENLGTSIILVTHNLGVVAQLCDRMAVMYAGNVVEVGSTRQIFENPVHPYTQGLMKAIPLMDKDQDRLIGIEGSVPDLINPPTGCRFYPRCWRCEEKCRTAKPSYLTVTERHLVACHHL